MRLPINLRHRISDLMLMGRWLLKKFFWSMVLSSVIMIGIQMTPHGKKANSHLAGILKGIQTKAKRTVASHAPESVHEVLGTVPMVAEKDTVSSSSTEYVFNDEQYVLINGKYYKARSDNTYMVNGEKVYYVSNRKKRGEASAEFTDTSAQRSADSAYPGADGEIKMPTSPGEMMETLKKAQEGLKRRNQMLKELDKEM